MTWPLRDKWRWSEIFTASIPNDPSFVGSIMHSIIPEGRKNYSASWLLVSDVDDTLLGDDHALIAFAKELEAKREQIIFSLNSSRPCASLHRSIHENPLIPAPDFLCGALGTEIESGETGQLIPEYTAVMNSGWERDQVAGLMAELGLEAHPDEFQTPFKASYTVKGPEQYQQVIQHLTRRYLDVKVIFSGNTNLDIIPRQAGKGTAIEFLRKTLGIDPHKVVTAGDSANDLDMFASPNKAIIVANAEKEIRALKGRNIYQAKSKYATGLLEGLRYWGVFPCE
jgi:sucrose-6F-phosphate phosphohydrolase